jgi:hypothetical protein
MSRNDRHGSPPDRVAKPPSPYARDDDERTPRCSNSALAANAAISTWRPIPNWPASAPSNAPSAWHVRRVGSPDGVPTAAANCCAGPSGRWPPSRVIRHRPAASSSRTRPVSPLHPAKADFVGRAARVEAAPGAGPHGVLHNGARMTTALPPIQRPPLPSMRGASMPCGRRAAMAPRPLP